jgi:hypothetical protein
MLPLPQPQPPLRQLVTATIHRRLLPLKLLRKLRMSATLQSQLMLLCQM